MTATIDPTWEVVRVEGYDSYDRLIWVRTVLRAELEGGMFMPTGVSRIVFSRGVL